MSTIFFPIGDQTIENDHGISLCTQSNKGHCECGDRSKGFTTYVFEAAGLHRCFTVYRPPNRCDEALPIVMKMQCYAGDKLKRLEMTDPDTGYNQAARRFGFARIALSSPNRDWKGDLPEDDECESKSSSSIYSFEYTNKNLF